MSRLFYRTAQAVIGLGLLLSSSLAVLATPTGLNNIPTAEVVPQRVLVLQGFSQFGTDLSPGWFIGAKYGPARNLEVGVDDTAAGTGSSAGPVLQGKLRLPLGSKRALALGAANLSGDIGRNGEIFPYLVVSAGFKAFNAHLGHSWQKDNRAWFVGIDHAVNRKLTLRADWIEANDGEDSLASLGFIQQIDSRWLVEAWSSLPSESGRHTSHIVKLDYVIPLGLP